MRLKAFLYSILWVSIVGLGAAMPASSQTVVDRTIATVSNGVRTELITRSDLLWQIALQPGTPLDPPREDDLRQALQTQINQRIFALEAQRLPQIPTEKEIADKIAQILRFIPTPEFERRLKLVGFSSIKDDNFENIISQRVAVDKYLDFRFRSFVVITAEDEANYYKDTWVPNFRRANPSVIVPTLEEARARVNADLVEDRVAASIETFLEEAKRRVQIVMIAEPV